MVLLIYIGFALLIVGIIIAMLHSRKAEKKWQRRRSVREAGQPRWQRYREHVQPLTGSAQVRWMDGQPLEERAATFNAWVTYAQPINASTRDWVQVLPEGETAVLADALAGFCHGMGFELAWLVDGRLADQANLNETLTAVATHYMEAYRLTATVRDDVSTFATQELV